MVSSSLCAPKVRAKATGIDFAKVVTKPVYFEFKARIGLKILFSGLLPEDVYDTSSIDFSRLNGCLRLQEIKILKDCFKENPELVLLKLDMIF